MEEKMFDCSSIVLGLILGAGIMAITWTCAYSSGFHISQETGDDICRNLTNNTDAVARDYESYSSLDKPIKNGGIVCELPSYDSTQNIVIKLNSE